MRNVEKKKKMAVGGYTTKIFVIFTTILYIFQELKLKKNIVINRKTNLLHAGVG